jgi:hypothetical protein
VKRFLKDLGILLLVSGVGMLAAALMGSGDWIWGAWGAVFGWSLAGKS